MLNYEFFAIKLIHETISQTKNKHTVFKNEVNCSTISF